MLPRLICFGQYSDDDAYLDQEARLCDLIGSRAGITTEWLNYKDMNRDLNVTDEQVRLLKLLAGPYGKVVAKMLKAKRGLEP